MVKSRSFIATPPGATIKEQLHDRGLSQKEFAVRMGMSEKHISKLINGEVQLNLDETAKIMPSLPGFVTKILVKEGDTVKKGQLLAVQTSH